MTVGTNILIGFGSSTKNVQGNGHINGDQGDMPLLWSHIDDRDGVDTPNWEVGPGGVLHAGPVEVQG